MDKQATAAADEQIADDHPEQRRTTSVYLPVDMLDELAAIARRLRVSRTWLIEDLVRKGLGKYRETINQ